MTLNFADSRRSLRVEMLPACSGSTTRKHGPHKIPHPADTRTSISSLSRCDTFVFLLLLNLCLPIQSTTLKFSKYFGLWQFYSTKSNKRSGCHLHLRLFCPYERFGHGCQRSSRDQQRYPTTSQQPNLPLLLNLK